MSNVDELVEKMRGLLAESLPYLDREAERQRQAINANLGSSREGWRAAVNLRARIYEAIKQLED